MDKKKLMVLILASVLILSLATVCLATIPTWSANRYYNTGNFVVYGGRIYQCLQSHTALVGWEPPNVPVLWRLIPRWTANTAYKVGDLVDYQLKVYKCLQAHTALVGWEPPNVPVLWQLIAY